jgi:glycosyltransferase involved in cell wall biosynthesis
MDNHEGEILYISYTGLLEPLGQSQVLAYLVPLAEQRTIHLLSFEKPGSWLDVDTVEAVRQQIASSGIIWHPLKYTSSTALDILRGFAKGISLCRSKKIKVIHARSYVPSVIAIYLKAIFRTRFVFDMRGFWADERVDGDIWAADSFNYRAAKWFERKFLDRADHIVVLTRAAELVLKEKLFAQATHPPITQIPTCVDLERFYLSRGRKSRPEGQFVVAYLGSASTWHLFDKVLEAFRLVLAARPEAELLIINRDEHRFIQEKISESGIPGPSTRLVAMPYSEIPRALEQVDASIFFYRQTFSRLACAPTKLGELLACGVPCMGNSGVGDVGEILQGCAVGAVVETFDQSGLSQAVELLLEFTGEADIAERCRDVAEKYFSLGSGVHKYREIYQQLALQD